MNKTQLIKKLSNLTDQSEAKCKNILSKLNNLIFDALKKGETIRINNIGKFYVKRVCGRTLKNPKTRRSYYSRSKNIVAFKISKALRNSII